MSAFGMPSSELPSEVASILPMDPFAQLELAHKIAAHALATKVAQLEADSQQLREALLGKQNHIKTLERRTSLLELELQEMHAKNKQAVEEAHRLQNEKAALIDAVKRLNKDVSRLEAFKKSLMQHIHEEEEPKLEPMSGDRLVSEVLSSVSKLQPSAAGQMQQQHQPLLHSTATVYAARGPASTPGYPSSSGRPVYSTTPQHNAAAAAAAAAAVAASTPGPAGYMQPQPRVDGKEFFRLARAQLSYEQFSQFLHNIKELNAGRQTRDETLRRARDIFGPTHPDLFGAFESLLSQHANPGF